MLSSVVIAPEARTAKITAFETAATAYRLIISRPPTALFSEE
jgi:hypothetical protein